MSPNKNLFWTKDRVTVLVAMTLTILVSQSTWVRELDLHVFDSIMSTLESSQRDDIVLIEIDEKSIAALGRWPWSRSVHAKLLRELKSVEYKTIAYSIFFSEPELLYSQKYLDSIREKLLDLGVSSSAIDDSVLWGNIDQNGMSERITGSFSAIRNNINDGLQSIAADVEAGISAVDADVDLARSLEEAENVLLPLNFKVSNQRGLKNKSLPKYTMDSLAAIRVTGERGRVNALTASNAVTPIALIGQKSGGVGHVNIFPEVDGVVRKHALVVNYFGAYFPSLALLTAAKSLGNEASDIHLLPGRGVDINGLMIPADDQMQTFPFLGDANENSDTFPRYSFVDVLNGEIPLALFSDKIILVGVSADGISNKFVTAHSAATPAVEYLAHSVNSILNAQTISKPKWYLVVQYGISLCVVLFLFFVFPRLKARVGLCVYLTLVLATFSAEYYFLSYFSLWLPGVFPAILLSVGYMFSVGVKFIMTERGLRNAREDSDENNRVLALTYQGQGQLDLAFDKFKRCSKTQDLTGALYSLGLDFERKRQTHKAILVYEYIQSIDGDFRGLDERIQVARASEVTTNLFDTKKSEDPTFIEENTRIELEKPTLGRYQIIKEIGKGGMGSVYLGIDPKINRTVAIKSLDLAKQADDDLKQRFFREAEAIGRLSHPNIVTVYDVGEEHDLAYIAMELLHGNELSVYTKVNNLLPIDCVVEIGSRCAEALSYAHAHSVIHRDIKPSNIMYDQKTKTTKITDFGVAQIMNKGATQTGMVIGTLGYMSPEQIKGEKLDSRTDIFSLGATLYQLLSGQKPFAANGIETASYNIVHKRETPLHEVNAKVNIRLSNVVAKAMNKLPEHRFSSGSELKLALDETKSARSNEQTTV